MVFAPFLPRRTGAVGAKFSKNPTILITARRRPGSTAPVKFQTVDSPASALNRVDLPVPLRPSSATILPSRIQRCIAEDMAFAVNGIDGFRGAAPARAWRRFPHNDRMRRCEIRSFIVE
jgi:hypothetical protein